MKAHLFSEYLVITMQLKDLLLNGLREMIKSDKERSYCNVNRLGLSLFKTK